LAELNRIGEVLEPDEFELTARARSGHELAEEGELLVALDTTLTPELEAEADAIEARHHHVEGHDVRPHTLERINGLTRIGNNVRRVAFLGQDAREQHRDVAVVLDDHDPRAGMQGRDGGRRPLFDHRDGPVSHLPCHM